MRKYDYFFFLLKSIMHYKLEVDKMAFVLPLAPVSENNMILSRFNFVKSLHSRWIEM